MSEKEVVKLSRLDEREEDKYMADAPEKFEEAMDDLDKDLNVEKVEEIQR